MLPSKYCLENKCFVRKIQRIVDGLLYIKVAIEMMRKERVLVDNRKYGAVSILRF